VDWSVRRCGKDKSNEKEKKIVVLEVIGVLERANIGNRSKSNLNIIEAGAFISTVARRRRERKLLSGPTANLKDECTNFGKE
jgi:hypothetical protein